VFQVFYLYIKKFCNVVFADYHFTFKCRLLSVDCVFAFLILCLVNFSVIVLCIFLSADYGR